MYVLNTIHIAQPQITFIVFYNREAVLCCARRGTQRDKGSISRLFVPIGFSNQDFNRSLGGLNRIPRGIPLN